jgi:outer membrane protein
MRIEKLLFLAAALLLTGTAINAQALKFGHVSLESIALEMPEYKQIQTTLDAETSKLENQFTTMREELGKIEADYQQKAATLTPVEREAKEKELMEMQGKVQAFFENAQQTLQQKNQELQLPVLEKLNNAVDAVGAEGGFMYIFEVKSGLTLYHSSQSIDITPLVKAKLGIVTE